MLENWGQMTKAQDDSQTINEAINAAILAHEEDPESHMGAGESIENHRVNEVIDHLAGSVVAGKVSSLQRITFSSFDSLDGWSKSVSGVDLTFPFVSFQTTSTINTTKELYSEVFFEDIFDYTKKPFFQILAGWNSSSDVTINLFIGTTLKGDNFDGFGFRLVNGVFSACYYRDGNLYTYTLSLPSVNTLHILRAQISVDGLSIEFFVDSILSYTVTIPTGVSVSPELFGFNIKNTVASNKVLTLGQLIFARDI